MGVGLGSPLRYDATHRQARGQFRGPWNAVRRLGEREVVAPCTRLPGASELAAASWPARATCQVTAPCVSVRGRRCDERRAVAGAGIADAAPGARERRR